MKTKLNIIMISLFLLCTHIKAKEITITMKDNLNTIDIYSKFIRVLKFEFIHFQNQLIDNDANYYDIRNYIYTLLEN
jgi:hypothetical protein